MSIDNNEHARIAGQGRAPDADGTATNVPADMGKPSAEHSQYGLVREGSKEAEGLTEQQIRGVEPQPAPQPDPPEVSPALPPQPSHIDNPQHPLPGNPPVMPEPTLPETKPDPGL